MKLRLALALAVVGVIVACSSEDPKETGGTTADAGIDVTTTEDASTSNEDTGAPVQDSGSDAPASTGQTSVVVTLNNVSRTLVRAQFGKSVPDATQETFYVEAHEGGDPACPTQSSPTPKRTLIVANIPRGNVGSVYTKADGIAATFFDFTNDQLPGVAPTKASALTLTIVKIDVGASPSDGSSLVEFELDATFAEGTMKGRIAATYCKSLDD